MPPRLPLGGRGLPPARQALPLQHPELRLQARPHGPEAFGIAYPLIADGGTVQARMAFIEAYRDRCNKARDSGLSVKWSPSLGHDPMGREHVLMDAVEKGRLTAKHVSGLLPSPRAWPLEPV